MAIDAQSSDPHFNGMKGECTAIIERAPEGGYWAICPEVPWANGQGETVEEANGSFGEAIRLYWKTVWKMSDGGLKSLGAG